MRQDSQAPAAAAFIAGSLQHQILSNIVYVLSDSVVCSDPKSSIMCEIKLIGGSLAAWLAVYIGVTYPKLVKEKEEAKGGAHIVVKSVQLCRVRVSGAHGQASRMVARFYRHACSQHDYGCA